MSDEFRPPLDVDNMLAQLVQIAAVARAASRPTEAGITLLSDEAYARLMRPCKGPNDDPTKDDLL